MPVIGKLLKRTTAITYKRNLKKKKDLANQIQTLDRILHKARKTAIAQAYNFENILDSSDRQKAFQSNVPITNYDEFYDLWLRVTMSGEKDHTWPGRVRHYALSSGTTGSPSKRIPVTPSMIRFFQKASLKQISILHSLNLSDEFYSGQILTVGGSSDLVKKENYVEGDLSGILRKYSNFFASPITRPGRKITKESDWNTKLSMMVDKAPEWNISIIAGVPSWCILLMEKIIEKHQLSSIHQIWPNLEVYVHGGVFMDPYIERLNKVLGRKIHLLDTYLASEGYFAYQTSPERRGMQLLLEAGVFFEFIPFNSDYFDENGDIIDPHAAFTIDEIQPEIDYALVITTQAGLWRYMIGDLVRFIDIEQRELIITGRIKQYLSLCGEHLSLDNINQAFSEVTKELNSNSVEFTIAANSENLEHHWFIASDNDINGQELMAKIDNKIRGLNDDYHCARKINLKEPMVTLLPTQLFYDFMEKQGKLGSQNKFPRVLNKEQKKQWLAFIEGES